MEIQVWGQVGRAFVGEYLEWSGGESVQRYYAGSRLIGLRGGGAVSFVLSDHLGSPSTLVGVGADHPIPVPERSPALTWALAA